MEVWNEGKIKDFADVKGGKRLPKGKQLVTEPNSHPYIRIRDLGRGKVLELNSDYEYVDDETQRSIARYTVESGDILISVVGTIGLIAIVGESLDKANQTENCDKIINLKGIDRDYLYYYLISPAGQEEIRKGTVGAVQPKLPLKNVQDITIKYPSLEIQKKIVSILNSIDDRISTNEAINRNLQEQAVAIFCEKFGGNEKNATVGEVSLNVTDGVHNSVKDELESDYYLLSCKNIKDGSLSIGLKERKISKEAFDKLRKRTKLAKGDILLTSVGTIGEMLLVNFEPNNIEFQRSVAIIKPNTEVVSSVYLYYALLVQKQEIVHAGHGAVQQCIFLKDIMGFEIHMPDKNAMQEFDEIVNPIADMIISNQRENERLCSMRNSLLPKLMSGELDVSNLDI